MIVANMQATKWSNKTTLSGQEIRQHPQIRNGHAVFIGPEQEENLSLRYLASALEMAGFRVEIIPFNSGSDLPGAIGCILNDSKPPLLVGISLAFQLRAKDCLALAMALREGGFQGHITVGGHFATFAASELLRDFPELDSVCIHEAEETIIALMVALSDGGPIAGVNGIVRRENGMTVVTPPLSLPDLTALPWPDRRGEPMQRLGHRIAPLVGSRGCYYSDCAFCCIAAWHKLIKGAPRYRFRDVDDIADEIAWLHCERGIDTFIFHDDNFFMPGRRHMLNRIHSLADALEARRIGRIATVVKARPNDVSIEVFEALALRLGCVRAFLGIETDSDQGLCTLARGLPSRKNHEALEIITRVGLYVCFNMLIFDPDTTLESLEANLRFMEQYGEHPLNFGRVELYAGTPLLARMQSEGRCRGDYLGWDYRLATPEIDRVFRLAYRCFNQRNYVAGCLANRLQTTYFDIVLCRHFHSEVFNAEWLEEGRRLNLALARSSAAGLREIVAFVTRGRRDAVAFVEDLSLRLRATENRLAIAATNLEQRIQAAVAMSRSGSPLSKNTSIRDLTHHK